MKDYLVLPLLKAFPEKYLQSKLKVSRRTLEYWNNKTIKPAAATMKKVANTLIVIVSNEIEQLGEAPSGDINSNVALFHYLLKCHKVLLQTALTKLVSQNALRQVAEHVNLSSSTLKNYIDGNLPKDIRKSYMIPKSISDYSYN